MRRVAYSVTSGTEAGTSGEASFHQFGTDFQEFEIGPAAYSTAIIELDDGRVLNLPCENIQFLIPV